MVEGAALNPMVESFGEFEDNTINVSAYGKNNVEAVKIMDRAG